MQIKEKEKGKKEELIAEVEIIWPDILISIEHTCCYLKVIV